MQTKIISVSAPQYRVGHKAIGKIVDNEIRKHFTGRTIVANPSRRGSAKKLDTSKLV